jgi:hypothetical protein
MIVLSLNYTDTKPGDLHNGIVTCGSTLLYYSISSHEKGHSVSWGSFANDDVQSFKAVGSVLQAKPHHDCAGNVLMDVLSSQVDDESMKYHALRYTLVKSKPLLQDVLINGSLAFVRFDNSYTNDIVYSRRNDEYLFRILTESETIIRGPIADGFSGRIMVIKNVYSKK